MTPKGRVSPFGHSRIKACSQLPGTFRRVPRPSSPLSAKASTKCPSRACSALIPLTQEQNPLNGGSQRTDDRCQRTDAKCRTSEGRRHDASRNARHPELGKAPGPPSRDTVGARGQKTEDRDQIASPLPATSHPAPRRGAHSPRGVRQEPSSQCQPAECQFQMTEDRTQGSDRFPAPGLITPGPASI